MWNEPTTKKLETIPTLYATEGICLDDKIIHAHFFVGGCDWWIAEYDGEDTFFGYANLGDPEMAEWGYISFDELRKGRVNAYGLEVDFDLHWMPKKFSEIN